MAIETGVARGLVLVVLASGALLGVGPLRRWCVARPWCVLTAIVGFDVLLLLYATTPFVPSGFDESQFLTSAHRVAGADVGAPWIRTPLPVMAIAAMGFHPAIPGILAKQVATILTYALLRRPLGVRLALFGALLVSSAEELVANCCEVISEPYGAAALAGFAFAVTRGGPISLFVTATLGAMSRWQLLWLLPAAAIVTWRRRGWRPVLVLGTLAAGCLVVSLWFTDVDPLRAFLQEQERPHSVLERVAFYFSPKIGLGLGPVGFLLAVIGAVALVRERPRGELAPAAMVFTVYVVGIVSIGVLVPRFMAPSIPLGVVLAVRGIASLLRRWPQLAARWPAAIAAAVIVVASAIPVHQPRTRARKLASPQAAVALDRDAVLIALGAAVPYSDVDAQKITAILARRCVAVGPGHAETVDGQVERDRIPSGSLYLTFDPGGRSALWSHGQLSLVRW